MKIIYFNNMRLIRKLVNFNLNRDGYIVTIGNYDGIHLGHKKILQEMVARAKKLNLKTIVITFLPRPREYFGKCCDNKRLMTLREKIYKFKQLGIDNVLLLKFDSVMANMLPEDFILNILVNRLNIKEIFVGEDFFFGKERRGNTDLLNKFAVEYNFTVNIIEPVYAKLSDCIGDQCESKSSSEGDPRSKSIDHSSIKVSSTVLRSCVESMDLKKIKLLLGRNFSIIGRIIHGNRLGTALGFPTANINLRRRIMFSLGVYVVRVWCLGKSPLKGIANIGFRPTVGDNKYLLEFYLFDFNENIYGKVVEVEFLYKIRVEEKFTTLELLKQQIEKDVLEAKQYFKKTQLVPSNKTNYN